MLCTLGSGILYPGLADAGVGVIFKSTDPQHPLHPTDITVLPNNRILVAGSHRVWTVDTVTNQHGIFAGTGERGNTLDPDPRKTEFFGATGIAVLPDGRVLIVDQWNHRVLVVNAEGSRIDLFAGTGKRGDHIDPGGDPTKTQLKVPHGVAVFPDGRVLISEKENHRVMIVSADGNHIEPFTGTGWEDDTLDPDPLKTALSFPEGVAVLPDGRALIADRNNKRVLAISADRTHTEVFAGNGTIFTAAGTRDPKQTAIEYPNSIAAFPDGRVLISNATKEQILIVTTDGTEIKPFAGTGTQGNRINSKDPLQTELNGIGGIHILPSGNVLIADSHNGRILAIT